MPAELQRRAQPERLDFAHARDERLGARVAMRAAGGDAQRRGRRARARATATSAPPSRRNAPTPRAPCHSAPVTGACTTPNTATPSSIRAMLTVNSPLRLTNSRVPSSGSTSHRRGHSRRCSQVAPRARIPPTAPGCRASVAPGRRRCSGARPGRPRSAASRRPCARRRSRCRRCRGSPRRRRCASAITPSRSAVSISDRWSSLRPQPLAGDEQCRDASGLRKSPRAGSVRAARRASTAPLPVPRARRRAGAPDRGRAPAPGASAWLM